MVQSKVVQIIYLTIRVEIFSFDVSSYTRNRFIVQIREFFHMDWVFQVKALPSLKGHGPSFRKMLLV